MYLWRPLKNSWKKSTLYFWKVFVKTWKLFFFKEGGGINIQNIEFNKLYVNFFITLIRMHVFCSMRKRNRQIKQMCYFLKKGLDYNFRESRGWNVSDGQVIPWYHWCGACQLLCPFPVVEGGPECGPDPAQQQHPVPDQKVPRWRPHVHHRSGCVS